MQNNFENSIKNKVEQFDGAPPEKLWTAIFQKMKNNTMENNSIINTRKIWLGVAAIVAVLLAAMFWKINVAVPKAAPPPSEMPTAHRVVMEGTGATANEMFPTELEMAKQQGKGIMAYVCMENCKFCEKFVTETLSLPEVHNYLEERFIQVAVDLRDKNNHSFLNQHEINAAPSALFFGSNGEFLGKSIGAIPTEQFMEIVDEAWNAISEDRDIVSQEYILPEIKIFPNPNNGNFNIQLKAASIPIFLRIVNEKGQEVYQQKQGGFSGYFEGKIDLTEFPKGIYYLQIRQGKKMITEKILVQ